MTEFLTYLHLLTPLHTGGSADEGNLMGIAREVHSEFPYLPASSLRGKIRSILEPESNSGIFFGQKIENGQQPTEGEVWFADASLVLFPIASLSHHLVWITCPLWLRRWNRWLSDSPLDNLLEQCQSFSEDQPAQVSFEPETLFLQNALIQPNQLQQFDGAILQAQLVNALSDRTLVTNILKKLIIVSDKDCAALVETGLQREVRVALETGSKTVKGGSFRSEEAIPPETVLFFPWGFKKEPDSTTSLRKTLQSLLSGRVQFGGLEGLGRGWTQAKTHNIYHSTGGTK